MHASPVWLSIHHFQLEALSSIAAFMKLSAEYYQSIQFQEGSFRWSPFAFGTSPTPFWPGSAQKSVLISISWPRAHHMVFSIRVIASIG
jgi:hypothetical protein